MPNSRSQPDWRALYPFSDHWLELGEQRRLHYVDEGSGTPVVMLHGNPTWSFYYRNLICGLRKSFRTVVPDHLGCGLSDKPQDYAYRLENHIRNLECLLLDTLHLDQITLVLHDWGGAIGMGFATRHPEKVSRIVVLNTAAFLLLDCPWRIRICRLPGFGTLALRGFNAFSRAALRMAVCRPEPLAPAVLAGLLAPYDSWHNRVAVQRFVQDIPLAPSHPTWQTLADIDARLPLLADKPMLICWGGRDFCFHDGFLAEWQRRFPRATAHRFAAAGHYILEDEGDAVLALIQSFLAAKPESLSATD